MDGLSLKKEITEIYKLVSSLSVQGDAVELVAMIRIRLRKLHESVDQIDKEDSTDENVGI